MFRSLFKKHNDDDIFEVDPVIEQRRKEKFSTPLIYDEEFKEEISQEQEQVPVSQPAPVSEEKETPKPKQKTKVNETKVVVEEKPKMVYQMREVISPMNGITKKNVEPLAKSKKTVKPKKKQTTEQLVPVISPFFGNYEEKTVTEPNVKLTSANEEVLVKKIQ